jgi:NAD(P)-dependent dehydrogenase (short-subunit alcohol dehydrogenase family)
VLEGVGLSGTKVIVTGGHSGLGLETTRALSKAGASVTVGARSARSLLSDPDLIGMPPTTVPLTTTDLASRR